MQDLRHYIGILMILSLLFACEGSNILDCLKKTGPITEKEIRLEPFRFIEVRDEMDIFLFNGNEQKVVLKAGENLIPEIHLVVEEGTLIISNDNACNWIRSPENPGIYVYSDDISGISTLDFVNLYTSQRLNLDNLDIYSDGTGNINLEIDVDSLRVESRFISNFEMSGKATYLYVYLTDDSRFVARHLEVEDCRIRHDGSNRIDLFPIRSLKGRIQSSGDVYYYNEPQELDVITTSTGRLVDLAP